MPKHLVRFPRQHPSYFKQYTCGRCGEEFIPPGRRAAQRISNIGAVGGVVGMMGIPTAIMFAPAGVGMLIGGGAAFTAGLCVKASLPYADDRLPNRPRHTCYHCGFLICENHATHDPSHDFPRGDYSHWYCTAHDVLPQSNINSSDRQCSRCLIPANQSLPIDLVLPCHHAFHQSCFRPWMRGGASVCPVCNNFPL